MTEQYLARKGSFAAAHRILNERVQCFNLHGHTYTYELIFNFHEKLELGYAIDFKEIKRVAVQWIEDTLDHCCLLNPLDHQLIQTAKAINSKLWLMSLHGAQVYCNPSVENIAKELLLAMQLLFANRINLAIHHIILHETPNCYTTCFTTSLTQQEIDHFQQCKGTEILAYAHSKGVMEYDDRK